MPPAHNSRARIDWDASGGPWAFCDRCNFSYSLQDLSWQYDWRGQQLANLRILVCDRCLDQPQEQLRAIFIPPDPMPVPDARPGFQTVEMTDYRVTQLSAYRITQADDKRIIDGESDASATEIIDGP